MKFRKLFSKARDLALALLMIAVFLVAILPDAPGTYIPIGERIPLAGITFILFFVYLGGIFNAK